MAFHYPKNPIKRHNRLYCVAALLWTLGAHTFGDERVEKLSKVTVWQESGANWALTIEFHRGRESSPMIATRLTNITQEERVLVTTPVTSQYQFLWDGEVPPPRKPRNVSASKGAGMRVVDLIEPGQVVSGDFHLDEYFILDSDKHYKLRIKRWLDDASLSGSAEGAAVKSNQIEFWFNSPAETGDTSLKDSILSSLAKNRHLVMVFISIVALSSLALWRERKKRRMRSLDIL